MGTFPASSPANSTAALTLLINSANALGWTQPTGGLDPVSTAFAVLGNLLNDAVALASESVGGVQAGATVNTRIVKAVTAIADATATAVLTITIPNAAHSASVRVRLIGSLGAGGAIGANEASCTVAYDIGVARTAGVAAVATASTAYGSGNAAVAGAATITCTAALAAVSGAVGAVNTIQLKVTITKGSGSSANHTCQVIAEVLNANATGVTIA